MIFIIMSIIIIVTIMNKIYLVIKQFSNRFYIGKIEVERSACGRKR